MDEGKLEEIGNKLDVSSDDIKGIKKQKQKMNILYPIISLIMIVVSGLLGYVARRFRLIGGTYPFERVMCASTYFVGGSLITAGILAAYSSKKAKQTKKGSKTAFIFITAILAIVAFIASYIITEQATYYNTGALYNVYSKEDLS